MKTVLFLSLAGLTTGAHAQSIPTNIAAAPTTASPAILRTFFIPGIDRSIARAELLAFPVKVDGAMLFDAGYAPTTEYGKAVSLTPMPVGGSVVGFLIKYPAERSVAMVSEVGTAGSSEMHACRVHMYAGGPTKPDRTKFSGLIRWCTHTVALANLDAASIAGDRPR